MRRSKDYDVRAAVVTALLGKGVPRTDIRHEITLDTYSSGGRADVVVLRDRLITIEIKSGSDKLDRLRDQVKRYEQSFDLVHVVCDVKHHEKDRREWNHYGTNWWCPENGFVDWGGTARLPEPPEFVHCQWGHSYITSVVNVASLLWRNEAVRVSQRLGGPNGTRVAAIAWMRENAKLCELRPLVIEELRARVPNRWEEAFWRRFDAPATEALG